MPYNVYDVKPVVVNIKTVAAATDGLRWIVDEESAPVVNRGGRSPDEMWTGEGGRVPRETARAMTVKVSSWMNVPQL